MTSFFDNLSDFLISARPQTRKPFLAPFHWVLMSNGLSEHDESIVLFGFERNACQPSLVAKVPRLPSNYWTIQIEYDRLQELWALLEYDEACKLLPEPYALANLSGQYALITNYLPGENLLRAQKKILWGNSNSVKIFLIEAGKTLRLILDKTSKKIIGQEKISSEFENQVEKFIKMYSLTEHERQVLSNLNDEVKKLQEKAAHKVLIQGDFWHGNILRNTEKKNLMVIDWQYSRWSIDASLDVYMILLAGALAASDSEDDPQKKARLAFNTLLTWKKDIIPAYLLAFGLPETYRILPLLSGMLRCCVEKTVRASMEIGVDQKADIIWCYLFKELTKWQDANG